jgi:hypothetical protein
MAALAQGAVSVLGIGRETTLTLLAPTGIDATSEGKPVKLSANNTVALPADGDILFGNLEKFEDRVQEGIKVAAVQTNGTFAYPLKASDLLAAGDYVVSGGLGTVKKASVVTSCVAIAVVSGVATVLFR